MSALLYSFCENFYQLTEVHTDLLSKGAFTPASCTGVRFPPWCGLFGWV